MHAKKSSQIKSSIGEVLNFDYEIATCNENSQHLQHKIEIYKRKFHERVLQIKVIIKFLLVGHLSHYITLATFLKAE